MKSEISEELPLAFPWLSLSVQKKRRHLVSLRILHKIGTLWPHPEFPQHRKDISSLAPLYFSFIT
jgi:hypothetical protein